MLTPARALYFSHQEEVAGMRVLLVTMNDRLQHLQHGGSYGISKPKSIWVCPVCDCECTTMRSYKAHIKRLAEPASHKPHCFLQKTKQRHVILVSRSAGANFDEKSQAFADTLWQVTQCLTSSDDGPGVSPPTATSHSTPAVASILQSLTRWQELKFKRLARC
jgi:hypothetical protein